MSRLLAWLACWTLSAGVIAAPAGAEPPLRVADAHWLAGVNIAVAEFTPQADERSGGAQLGRDYIYPSPDALDYYLDKGFRLLRVPFRAIRVIERSEGTSSLAEEFDRLVEIIDHAESRGAFVVLDIHDYGRTASGGLIGRDPGAAQEFADIWRAIAERVRDRPTVMFGLMNEPHEQTAAEWLEGANAAIAAIREAGAQQIVLVPGSYWSGAHSWLETDNAEAMLGVVDPLDNYAYEVHQYLDSDSSARSPTVVRGAGATRLAEFTAWAREHGKRAFLGEFGWADNAPAHREGEALLAYMADNKDVWFGWAYWAGGPWWGDYMLSVEPLGGVDRPQMRVLSRFIDP